MNVEGGYNMREIELVVNLWRGVIPVSFKANDVNG